MKLTLIKGFYNGEIGLMHFFLNTKGYGLKQRKHRSYMTFFLTYCPYVFPFLGIIGYLDTIEDQQ